MIHSRVIAALAILPLVACEAATFIATADLQLAAIEARAAPVHDAEAKRKAAEDWVARLEGDDRVERAERALKDAQADARVKSTTPDCGKNCAAILAKTVDNATTAVADARQSLELERRQARTALAAAPSPPSPSPLADRLGVAPSTLDLLFVGFRGFAVAAGAAIVLAVGAQDWERRTPSPLATVIAPVTALLPKPKGDVDKFLLEHVKRAKSGTVSWAALYVAYRTWCLAAGLVAVDAKDFGVHLDALRADLGLKVRTEGQDVLFLGLKLAS